jgi:hypothetical protein
VFGQLTTDRDYLRKKIKVIGSTPLLLVTLGAVLVSVERPDAKRDSDLMIVPVKSIALRHHGPMQLHRRRNQTTSESYNWSGYAVTGLKGAVTDVTASWIVPFVSDCSMVPDGYAAFWTGIDGWNSNTVEQIGTDSDCESPQGAPSTPTYYAWFEFYPQSAYYIGNPNDNFLGYAVSPGDIMWAEVKSGGAKGPHHGAGQQFTVTISDKTKNWTFTTTSSVSSAQQSSAEWIAETPHGCPGYCPLADFNFGLGAAAEYGEDYTLLENTASATVNGVTGAIASFGNNVQQAVMVNYPSGSTTMAAPTGLTDSDKNEGSTSFTVGWGNAGP